MSNKPTLTYYFDALCGWCYGFSPVISQIEKKYSSKLDIEVISGGLFLGERTGPVNQVAPYIKEGAYKRVEEFTGVKFGESFLNDIHVENKIILNSLHPAIAMAIVKKEKAEKAFQFAEKLLSAIYFDGLNINDLDVLAKLSKEIGFDEVNFKNKLQDSSYLELAENEFKIFKDSPFGGMPALAIQINDQEILLSNGYSSFEDISKRLDSVL